MFNLDSLEKTPLLVITNLVVYLLLFLMLKSSLKGKVITAERINASILLILLFCLFSFWGSDWFHYLYFFPLLKAGAQTHIEDLYITIAQLSPDYIVFRMIIWGAALLCFLLTLKRLVINQELALLVFCAGWLIWFSYSRVSLAMAVMFFGVSLIYKPINNRNFLSTIFGLLVVALSFYLHKSSAFGIGVILLAIVSEKLKSKYFAVLLIIMLPVVFYLVQHFLVDFMLSDVDADEGALGASAFSGQRYLGKSEQVKGIASIIAKTLERIPYYLSAFCCFKLLSNKFYFEEIPQVNRVFLYICFYIVVFASLFAFDMGYTTNVIYSRFMRFAAIPCVFSLSYAYENDLTFKTAKLAIYASCISCIYSLLYSVYIS